MENFDNLFDVEALRNNLDKAQKKEFKDVVPGIYEVRLESCALAASSTNKPMCKMKFTVIGGEYDNQPIFYNKVLVGTNASGELNAMGLHFNNLFLKSMKIFADEEIKFVDFRDYSNLLADIEAEANELKMTFKLEYSKKGDFANYRILDVYKN